MSEYMIVKTPAKVNRYGIDTYRVMINKGADGMFSECWDDALGKYYKTQRGAENALERIKKKGDKVLPMMGGGRGGR